MKTVSIILIWLNAIAALTNFFFFFETNYYSNLVVGLVNVGVGAFLYYTAARNYGW